MNSLPQKLQRLHRYASQVHSQTHKSPARQLRDFARLRRINPACTLWDYYHFQLYQHADAQQSQSWRDFSGARIHEALNRALNPRSVVSAAWDKLQLAALLKPCNLASTEIRAVYKPHGGIPLTDIEPLIDAAALRRYLRRREHYPLFAKPCYSQQGIGAFLFADYDAATDQIVLGNGTTMAVDHFIDQHIDRSSSDHYRPEAGYLFQTVLRQHEALNAFQASPTISGFRIVVLNGRDGPQVFRALWKLAIGRNSHDNFSLGAYGNLVGQIDLSTGRMPYALDAIWPQARMRQQHPDTGRHFADFAIPQWSQLLALACAASSVFPLMKILHWDMVLTGRGPVILELNDLGSIPFHQLCGQGFLDARMRQHLREHGQIAPGSLLARAIA